MMSSIARTPGISLSTVSRVLARAGLSRLSGLEPQPPPNRYERASPGELLHIDIKRLGGIRGVGHRITGDRSHRTCGVPYDVTYVAVDHHSRAPSPKCGQPSAPTTLPAFWITPWPTTSVGLRVQRVLTDNGKVFAKLFVGLCHDGIKRLHLRPTRNERQSRALYQDGVAGMGLWPRL
jgi:hypothetical protein